MKFTFRNPARTKISWWVTCVAFLFLFVGCKKGVEPPKLMITTVASGLVGPMGIETDNNGNIWVSESGTAKNDGKVVVIKPNGAKYDGIVNLSSFLNINTGELQGTVNMLRDGGILYVLSGNYMYRADISHFKPGDKPIDANTLPYEDISKFVYAYPFVNNAHDSHPYNLTKGPDGDLYITDAGANAVIHRKGINSYSVLAEIPQIVNPTPKLGGPMIQPVPTSIWYDGQKFLVTTLTGFPFPVGKATVFQITRSGKVSTYQTGFTMLVDQAEGTYSGHIAVQYSNAFNLTPPPPTFASNAGALVWFNGSTIEPLKDGLNMPVAIKQVNDHTWYVTIMGDGTVIKVTYY